MTRFVLVHGSWSDSTAGPTVRGRDVPLRSSVIIPFIADAIGAAGQPKDPRTHAAVKVLLDDLAWWATALHRALSQGTLPPAAFRLMATHAGAAK